MFTAFRVNWLRFSSKFVHSIASVEIPASQPYSAAQERHEKRVPDAETITIVALMRRQGYSRNITIENSFGAQANDPEKFVQRVIHVGLDGWDYINAEAIFKEDRLTPNDTFEKLRHATTKLILYLNQKSLF